MMNFGTCNNSVSARHAGHQTPTYNVHIVVTRPPQLLRRLLAVLVPAKRPHSSALLPSPTYPLLCVQLLQVQGRRSAAVVIVAVQVQHLFFLACQKSAHASRAPRGKALPSPAGNRWLTFLPATLNNPDRMHSLRPFEKKREKTALGTTASPCPATSHGSPAHCAPRDTSSRRREGKLFLMSVPHLCPRQSHHRSRPFAKHRPEDFLEIQKRNVFGGRTRVDRRKSFSSALEELVDALLELVLGRFLAN